MREWQTKGPLRITLSLTLSRPTTTLYWHQAFERYEDWGAGRKLLELAKLHPCLKEKGGMSTVIATRGGRANARSRFKQISIQKVGDPGNDDLFYNFWRTSWCDESRSCTTLDTFRD